MRIAIISDIHGNFVALQTVLADIEREHVDQIVCLGDVACNGPYPREVISCLKEIDCLIVMGNTDEMFLSAQNFDPKSERERKVFEIIRWSLDQPSSDELQIIRSYKSLIDISLGGDNHLLCFHGSPQSNTEIILATTPDEELLQRLGNFRATVMAGGHTHQQMLRRFRDMTIINPGSVGLPIIPGATPAQDRRPPWSEYAIVDSHDENIAIEFRRVPLDVPAVVRAARESGMPQVEFWVAGW